MIWLDFLTVVAPIVGSIAIVVWVHHFSESSQLMAQYAKRYGLERGRRESRTSFEKRVCDAMRQEIYMIESGIVVHDTRGNCH